jgi:hypothetical protein
VVGEAVEQEAAQGGTEDIDGDVAFADAAGFEGHGRGIPVSAQIATSKPSRNPVRATDSPIMNIQYDI